MKKPLVLATNNLGKIAEFEQLLQDIPFQLIPQDHYAIPPVDETGLTFIENAILKARWAATYTKSPALSDDSGLVVPSLDGEPGIYSARYAGNQIDMIANQKKLLSNLEHKHDPERAAYFYCCLVFMRYPNDPTPLITEGTWEGFIAFEPRGEQGFGYDPLFYIPQLQCTAAELSLEEKNRLSHRAKALLKMKERLLQDH